MALRHEQGQERAGGADEGAGDDERLVVEDETGERRREAGQRVEDGDDDRHVGAADRQHDQRAEHERGDEERDDEEVAERSACPRTTTRTREGDARRRR